MTCIRNKVNVLHTMTDGSVDKQLASLYYSAGDPASYGGVERLYDRAVQLGIPNISRARVRKFLTKQVTYALHKPAKRKFQHNQTKVSRRDEQWQADLAIMSNVSSDNGGYNYILTCIDVLSRYAWAVPVRTKGAAHMLEAIQQLFQQAAPRKPKRLQTDKGKEFYNAIVRKYLSEQGVELFSTNSDYKAALVERFNRTLKGRIYRHFTANNTRRYVDVLADIVHSYNHSYHRTIGRAPADITSKKDDSDVWRRVYYQVRRRSSVMRMRIPPISITSQMSTIACACPSSRERSKKDTYRTGVASSLSLRQCTDHVLPELRGRYIKYKTFRVKRLKVAYIQKSSSVCQRLLNLFWRSSVYYEDAAQRTVLPNHW